MTPRRPPGGSTRRTLSSRRWLERQARDPFVKDARAKGYRSRAAFKLIQLDDRFRLLRPGARAVDLGAAPGGWAQVAARRVGAAGRVVAVDIQAVAPIAGVVVVHADARDAATLERIRAVLEGPADVVLSDMAAAATGERATDHLRVIALAEAAFDIARRLLAPGGAFVCKVLQGGATGDLRALIRRDFGTVRHVKPAASRAESHEVYLVARGFRGPAAADAG
ncbi:MAG: RlmE family RNA methyltransferase [Alphaproteobacteria bacterium]